MAALVGERDQNVWRIGFPKRGFNRSITRMILEPLNEVPGLVLVLDNQR